LSRKEIEAFSEYTALYGIKPLYYTKVKADKSGFETGVAKFFTDEQAVEIISQTRLNAGQYLLMAAGDKDVVNQALGQLRNYLGKTLDLAKEGTYEFVWINDFPLFEWDKQLKKWNPMHHLFTKPKSECMAYLDTDPGKVLGNLYDLVLNGTELISGSIRINTPELQQKIMDIIQMPREEADSKFGFLLDAFQYGAPPHGGCALGFDRFVALLAGESSIKEVIAFPNNASGAYPLDGSPSPVSKEQLDELHLKIT
jgi:aspartyl-tRNA synthetase